uniref:Uncharacterized protein n=1 Tax=Pristionchus pacificus TaxID=54126 RepID=A0A2A6CBN5_PRIPA|eukprot:PDM75510.1 hypothetical protein PRIPAC_42687 [Pristionchus pacificus]
MNQIGDGNGNGRLREGNTDDDEYCHSCLLDTRGGRDTALLSRVRGRQVERVLTGKTEEEGGAEDITDQ